MYVYDFFSLLVDLGSALGNGLSQGGRGQWAVYYNSPHNFEIMFSYSLAQQIWELILNFK